MGKEIVQQLVEKYGERATDSEFERSLYTRDLAPVPALLVKPLFRTLPDIVVRPANTEEVADIMQTAYRNNIPVTPRAGASTVYFDSVPTHSGILMDLNLLQGIVGLDEAGLSVKVRAATTWSELEEYLHGKGLACKSMPSSAPVATIGGWFCMMGYGIGSLKYGSLLSQVKSIQVVLPDGTVKKATRESRPALDWFVSSEGTLGIITELELEVRRKTGIRHFLLKTPDNADMAQVMRDVVKAPMMPYNMHFSDQYCLEAMQSLGFSPADLKPGCLVGIDYEGPDKELQQAGEIIQDLASANRQVEILPQEMADGEWEERYKALRLKRGGPSVLGAEIWLPLKSLTAYLEDVQKMSRAYALNLVSYGHVVTPEYATVMTTFYANETRTIRYIINLSLVKKIHDIGYRHGGYPYGVGLWNTPYLKRIYKIPQIGELRARKKSLDDRGIMNPGKVYRAPFMFNPFNYTVAMNVLAGVRKVLGKGW